MIWIYVWELSMCYILFHVWELATPCGTESFSISVSFDMWYREVSLLHILWYVVMDYVCMYVWDLSSTLAGRLVAFLWFVCPFKYLVWTLLCWYVLITFPLWLCLCDISLILRLPLTYDIRSVYVNLLCIWQMIFLSAEDYDVLFLILIYVLFIRFLCYISFHWAF